MLNFHSTCIEGFSMRANCPRLDFELWQDAPKPTILPLATVWLIQAEENPILFYLWNKTAHSLIVPCMQTQKYVNNNFRSAIYSINYNVIVGCCLGDGSERDARRGSAAHHPPVGWQWHRGLSDQWGGREPGAGARWGASRHLARVRMISLVVM